MIEAPILSAMTFDLFLSEKEIGRIIARAPHAYKTYTIKKRAGGFRKISQPSVETKYIQSWLIENVFCGMPVHECASAYKKGGSIKLNAAAHSGNEYLVKFDFKNFFTSIKSSGIERFILENYGDKYDVQDAYAIARACTIIYPGHSERCLSIGAPTSPIISNILMYEFDVFISGWCTENSVTYTRYADDLAFSTNEKGMAGDIQSALREAMRRFEYANLRLNHKKTAHLSKKSQRRITGLVINNEGKVSLGRKRKRMIRALVHKYELGVLPEAEVCMLQGLLAFAQDVEPLFMSTLRAKYSSALISRILEYRKK